jgi:DNA-binding LytR/AlgR family response regulator
MTPTALIAEDEPLLGQALKDELKLAWPELDVIAISQDGRSALTAALTHLPDIIFLDIRMPELSGLEVALELGEQWPVDTRFPILIFVTAYDQHAIRAFEAQAFDYLLKPISAARLSQTVLRARRTLVQGGAQTPPNTTHNAAQSNLLLSKQTNTATGYLSVIAAADRNATVMLRVTEILFFEAADKYVRVVTAEREALIRTPIKDLIAQIDPALFWQVHRGTLVRIDAIRAVQRDENGRLSIELHGSTERLAISRVYAHLFKPM